MLIRPALKDTKERKSRKMRAVPATGVAAVPHTIAVILVEIFLNPSPTPSRGATVTRVTTSLGTLGSPTSASPGKHPPTTDVAKMSDAAATVAPGVGVRTGTILPLCTPLHVPVYPCNTMSVAPIGPTPGLSNKARFRKEAAEIPADSYGEAKFPTEINTPFNVYALEVAASTAAGPPPAHPSEKSLVKILACQGALPQAHDVVGETPSAPLVAPPTSPTRIREGAKKCKRARHEM